MALVHVSTPIYHYLYLIPDHTEVLGAIWSNSSYISVKNRQKITFYVQKVP